MDFALWLGMLAACALGTWAVRRRVRNSVDRLMEATEDGDDGRDADVIAFLPAHDDAREDVDAFIEEAERA
jgi:hypothetical protein